MHQSAKVFNGVDFRAFKSEAIGFVWVLKHFGLSLGALRSSLSSKLNARSVCEINVIFSE